MKKFFVGVLTIIIILLFIWLQEYIFNYFSLFGVITNIGIILIITISMCAGKNIGAIAGLIYGALFDIAFENSFGVYMLLFGLLGYLVGLLKGEFALDNQFSLLIIVAVSTILIEIANLLFLSFKNTFFDFSYLYVFKVISLEVIYNIFLTFIMYKPLMLLGDIINRSRRAYYEL